MHEFVTATHPEVGTIRCTRAAFESNYKAKGFRLDGPKKSTAPKPVEEKPQTKPKASLSPVTTDTPDIKEQ